MAPTPIDAPIRPQADGPPSFVLATIGPRTKKAAIEKFHNACAPRFSRYQRRLVTARKPSASSVQKLAWPFPVIGGTLMRESEMALTTKVAASMAKTQPGPITATSTPATAGPPTSEMLRESPIRAFACCSRGALTV